MAESLSLRAYAEHRGVRLSAVQKAIATGRIAKLPDGRIDPEAADAAWAANTAVRMKKPQPDAPRPDAPRQKAAPEHHSVQHRPATPAPGQAGQQSALDFSKARAVQMSYVARNAQLDYEERIGKLVSADEMKVAAFSKFRQFRDRLLNVPDRIAASLAAEKDTGKCRDLVSNEIRRALLDFADANS